MPPDLTKFEVGIAKTGYVLENRIASMLEKAGWSVLNNRYYIDDAQETVREIDLVAFRTSKTDRFTVYTSLIISCKKSERPWALLSRDINLKKPNVEWWPLHVWTNDKAVEYVLKQQGASKQYYLDASEMGVSETLRMPDVDVFAFQEMDAKTGDPKNDSRIFDSITALMKAQAYEMAALPSRRKEPAIYQFNLLSILDGEMIRLNFSGDQAKAESIESEHYIAEYIVRKQRTTSRIHFITARHFEKCLPDYKCLHAANSKLLSDKYKVFYRNVLDDAGKVDLFIGRFREGVNALVAWRLRGKFQEQVDLSDLSIEWHPGKGIAVINSISFSKEHVIFLNDDTPASTIVRSYLKKIYKYEGEFCFDSDDIPP